MAITPNRPKGPPLNAMRAFEAAARLGGFVAAGEELGVTAGAISQHIKALEEWAGTALFRRNAQGVELTAAGRALLPAFRRAFDALADATHALRNLRPDREVHIAALPSVAQLWLPSRLGRIRSAFPDLSFSVTALETPPRLARELFDLSIFVAEPTGADTERVIAPDLIRPVAAPAVAAAVAARGDLGAATLLHDQSWKEDWPRWSAAADTALDDPTSGPKYSLYSLAVEEAKAGAGVLMGHLCLLDAALSTNQLVPLDGPSIETGRALVLQMPGPDRRRAVIDDVIAHLVT